MKASTLYTAAMRVILFLIAVCILIVVACEAIERVHVHKINELLYEDVLRDHAQREGGGSAI